MYSLNAYLIPYHSIPPDDIGHRCRTVESILYCSYMCKKLLSITIEVWCFFSSGQRGIHAMHECRKSYIINGKLKNNKIKKHTIATSFELLLLDRNYCSPISFCSKIQYLLLLSFVFSYYTLFIFIISMLIWFMVRRQQQPTK